MQNHVLMLVGLLQVIETLSFFSLRHFTFLTVRCLRDRVCLSLGNF